MRSAAEKVHDTLREFNRESDTIVAKLVIRALDEAWISILDVIRGCIRHRDDPDWTIL